MLADELDYVLGVDTHRDEHVMAAVTAPAAALIAGAAAPADTRGYRELLRLAERHAPGRRAWAIEGTGSYGAGLARFLAGRGETVLELSRTPRAERRRRRLQRSSNLPSDSARSSVSWRSPPRLSRGRTVRPLEAGSGANAGEAGEAGLGAQPAAM